MLLPQTSLLNLKQEFREIQIVLTNYTDKKLYFSAEITEKHSVKQGKREVDGHLTFLFLFTIQCIKMLMREKGLKFQKTMYNYNGVIEILNICNIGLQGQ